ncbi:MAG TPA: peptidyl-prolyl cis-trans isomerase [Candidatus Dormibacteraeota bacterium]|nr:peptidyl-prolyl cis-trans isomerase [Candidatus Dormibacteraeota bacterium]
MNPVKHPLPFRARIPVLPLFLGLLWVLPVTAAPAPAPPVAIQRADTVTIAVVDGIPIQKLQWDRLADPYFREVEARAGRALTGDEKTLLRKNVFEELVRERLWVADAKRRGFTATEAELDARLQKNDYFKTAGKVDPEKFRQFKYSPESNYRVIAEQVRNAVLLDKYVAWMRTRYAIPESELRKEFQSRTAQASIRYLWLTTDLAPLEREATAEEIRAYYDRHAEEFQSPEEARLTYLRVPIEPAGRASDSLRAAVEAQTQLAARALLAALRAGRSAETVAKEYGGVHDTGIFRVGDPVRGLGRSDALVEALKNARPKQWLPDPLKFGTFYIIARLEEHREPKARPFREVVGQVKRHADTEVRSAETDSLARIDFAARPERYRVPLLRAVVLARATDSFTDSRPVSDRDLSRALERIRKSSGMPDTAHVWADSMLKSLPDLVRKERQLDLAFRTLGDAAFRLRRGEAAEEVARRFDATLDPVSIYRGQPPERALLLEGSLLDSLYTMSPGSVVGPRVLRDSVFVARVVERNDRYQPPYEAVRPQARSEIELKRRAETERAARSWFESHRDRYQTPRRWAFDYVLFAKMKADSAPVPEDSIRAYYETHKIEFTVPARARVHHVLIGFRPGESAGARSAARAQALEVLRRAKAGEDFESLAKENSTDRTSAAKGGDLGEITRGQVVKEFGDAAFALQDGELSPVVETQFGFHVIRMDHQEPQRLRTLDDSRAEIRGVLGESLVDTLASEAAGSFARRAEAPGARFEELAKEHGGMIASPPVAQGEPSPGVGPVPEVEERIGSLAPGGVSRPIQVERGYLVARLTRAVPPREAEFGAVKDQAIQDMELVQRRALVDSIGAALRRDLERGKDLETLAIPLGGLRLSRSFPRTGPVPELARDSVLARDSSFYAEIFSGRPGHVLRPRAGAMGTLYAVVDSVSALGPKEYAEHKNELREELFERQTAAWTDRLRSRATIRVYRNDLRL